MHFYTGVVLLFFSIIRLSPKMPRLIKGSGCVPVLCVGLGTKGKIEIRIILVRYSAKMMERTSEVKV